MGIRSAVVGGLQRRCNDDKASPTPTPANSPATTVSVPTSLSGQDTT